MNEKENIENMNPDSYIIYYDPQVGWGKEDYYYLHRVLHRMIYYYDKNKEEITRLDVSRMTENTKVLLNCIIRYYDKDFIFDIIPLGEELRDVKPLKTKLVLDDNPLAEDNVYKEMNVVY